MQVLWYQNGRMVKPDAAQGIFIEKRIVQNCSLIARYDCIRRILVWFFLSRFEVIGLEFSASIFLTSLLWFPVSALTISNIQPGFTGNWECRIRTSRGNTTRTVHIVVLETSSKYCAPERVTNNRGEFKLVCTHFDSHRGLIHCWIPVNTLWWFLPYVAVLCVEEG